MASSRNFNCDNDRISHGSDLDRRAMDSPSAMMDPVCVLDLIFLELVVVDDADDVRAAKKGSADADNDDDDDAATA